MATAKQIQFRLGQAKKKLAKVTKEVTGTKKKVQSLESQLKKAKVVTKSKVKPKARPKARPKAKARRKSPARKR